MIDVVTQRPAGQPVGPRRPALGDPLVPHSEVPPDLPDDRRAAGEQRPVRRGPGQLPGGAQPGRRIPARVHGELDEMHPAAQPGRRDGTVHHQQVPGRQRTGLLAQGQEVGEHHHLAMPGGQAGHLARVRGQRQIRHRGRHRRVHHRTEIGRRRPRGTRPASARGHGERRNGQHTRQPTRPASRDNPHSHPLRLRPPLPWKPAAVTGRPAGNNCQGR